jgi:hypothetical protein
MDFNFIISTLENIEDDVKVGLKRELRIKLYFSAVFKVFFVGMTEWIGVES